LTKRQDLVAKRGHQGCVFPHFAAAVDFGKAQSLLRGRLGQRQITAQLAAQQDDPLLSASTHQPQCRFLALPILPGVAPVHLAHRLLQRGANVFSQP